MAYRGFQSVIFPFLLVLLSMMSCNRFLAMARHLQETNLPIPELPAFPELPDFPDIPSLPMPELPTLPNVELPPFPGLPTITNTEEEPDKPEANPEKVPAEVKHVEPKTSKLPSVPHIPDLPKPTLPATPSLPKDVPEPTHSETIP